jgi:hypothetical protein
LLNLCESGSTQINHVQVCHSNVTR